MREPAAVIERTPGDGFQPYREHCRDCGIDVEIDELVRDPGQFRIHVSITNTGEIGAHEFMLDGCQAYALTETVAMSRVSGHARRRLFGTFVNGLAEQADTIFGLRRSAASPIPPVLNPGESWSGWLESIDRPLADDHFALILQFGSFRSLKTGRAGFHFTHGETQPFVNLKRDVRVQPTPERLESLTPVFRFLAQALNWHILAIVVTGILVAVGLSFLGVFPLLGYVAGVLGGYLLVVQIEKRLIFARYRKATRKRTG
jgi:hypothetical protein